MARHNPDHHARLEQLRDAEAKERMKARDLQAKAEAAKAAADAARAALVDAHANGIDIKRAEKQRTTAQADAEDLAIQAEASGLRIKRAESERKQYEADHAGTLIEELGPEAMAVTARLEGAARELVDADKEWTMVLGKVDSLLQAMPAASPRADGRIGHRLAGVARDARNALRTGKVEPPLPTWYGLQAHEEEQRKAREARESAA